MPGVSLRHKVLGIAAVSAAVAGKVEVRVDGAWTREWVAFYTVIIAPPGERKSAAFRMMTEPLRVWESRAAAKVAPRRRVMQQLADVADRRLRITKEKAAKGTATADQVEAECNALQAAILAIPASPELLAQDATPEALVEQMAEQGGRVALMSPEGGPLQILDGRYSDGAARLEELAHAYDGEEIRPRRIGRATRPVRHPALTLAVALQPSVLHTIRNGRSLRGQGIFGRISWAFPPSRVGTRVDSSEAPPMDQAAARAYDEALNALLEWEGKGKEEDGTFVRSVMTLTRDAAEIKIAYHYELESAVVDGGNLAGIRDWANKTLGRAIRVAALLELVARAHDGHPLEDAPISGRSMRGAVEICRALTSHALCVYSETQGDGPTAMLHYVWTRARTMPEGQTLRDLFRRCQGRTGLESMEELDQFVDQLSERGCLRLLDQPPTGGRPGSPVVEVHPTLRQPRPHVGHDGSDGNPTRTNEAPASVTSVIPSGENQEDPTLILAGAS